MLLNDLETNDYFTWKHHLKCHFRLILIGSIIISVFLAFKSIDSPDGPFRILLFGIVMSLVLTTFLMIPYSLIVLLLHKLFVFSFFGTKVIHLILTSMITILFMQVMGLAMLGGFVFGLAGLWNLNDVFRKRVKALNE